MRLFAKNVESLQIVVQSDFLRKFNKRIEFHLILLLFKFVIRRAIVRYLLNENIWTILWYYSRLRLVQFVLYKLRIVTVSIHQSNRREVKTKIQTILQYNHTVTELLVDLLFKINPQFSQLWPIRGYNSAPTVLSLISNCFWISELLIKWSVFRSKARF